MNEEIWELAVHNALGTFLSDWPSSMSAVDVLEKIDSYGEKASFDWDDNENEDGDATIIVWEPFEHDSGETVADYIDSAARCAVDSFADVARILEHHIVELACEDALPTDLNDLDLVSFVRSGESPLNPK